MNRNRGEEMVEDRTDSASMKEIGMRIAEIENHTYHGGTETRRKSKSRPAEGDCTHEYERCLFVA